LTSTSAAGGDTGRNIDRPASRLRVRNQKDTGDGKRHQQNEKRDDQHISTLHETALHELRITYCDALDAALHQSL
jgi:hypothetical protein